MDDHKQKLDKEYDQLKAQFSKDLEKVKIKHAGEQERRVSLYIHTFNSLTHLTPKNTFCMKILKT